MGSFTQTLTSAVYMISNLPGVPEFNTAQLSGGYHSSWGSNAEGSLLFTDVTVPKGASIASATLSMAVEFCTGTPLVLCYGEDADDPSQMANGADFASRTLTTASVNPAITSTGAKNVDVKSIVDEIIARAGWVAGNNMQFIFRNNGSTGINYWQSVGIDNQMTLTIQWASSQPQIMIF